MKRYFIVSIIIFLLIIPNICLATDNSNYYENIVSNENPENEYNCDYILENYDVDMIVNENNTIDITETIIANFYKQRRGIYRKIPILNNITRADGTNFLKQAQVTNIDVNDEYIVEEDPYYKTIRIGNENKVITGKKKYVIKYTYNVGKDPLKDEDELYFNIIGNDWKDTVILKANFNIHMPKKFDKNLLSFTSGFWGGTDDSNVQYSVNGNDIVGYTTNTLYEQEALTVRLVLPEGYFVGAHLNFDTFSIVVIGICILFVFISYMIWRNYGKDDEVVETVEFYPPEGYNSAEIGFLYKGSVSDDDVISLLIYLANKGYLKIEESDDDEFKITKLKEYDGENAYEKLFLDGMFKNNEKTSVTKKDLYNNFYITIEKIEQKINSKENKYKIFKKSSLGKRKYLKMMITFIICLISIKPVMICKDDENLIASWFGVVCIIFFWCMIILVQLLSYKNNYSNKGRLFSTISFLVVFYLCIHFYDYLLPILKLNKIYLITYIIGIVCIVILIFFIKIMPKRTTYGNEILGKLRGFKNFLEIAEKQQLEELVNKNPEYFYDILPYTYALGVSSTWIEKFKVIGLMSPKWYSNYNVSDFGAFDKFMNEKINTVIKTMESRPSSSGSHSSGGGSSGRRRSVRRRLWPVEVEALGRFLMNKNLITTKNKSKRRYDEKNINCS